MAVRTNNGQLLLDVRLGDTSFCDCLQMVDVNEALTESSIPITKIETADHAGQAVYLDGAITIHLNDERAITVRGHDIVKLRICEPMRLLPPLPIGDIVGLSVAMVTVRSLSCSVDEMERRMPISMRERAAHHSPYHAERRERPLDSNTH